MNETSWRVFCRVFELFDFLLIYIQTFNKQRLMYISGHLHCFSLFPSGYLLLDGFPFGFSFLHKQRTIFFISEPIIIHRNHAVKFITTLFRHLQNHSELWNSTSSGSFFIAARTSGRSFAAP